jgi:transcriptional regulator with XRE-family HTH domain
MGTIERGETNLSLQNLARVAAGLGITLSKMLSGVERQAAGLGADGAQTNAPPSRSNSPRRRA